MTEPHTASEPSGQELVIVGMAGRRNGPTLSMRYDDDDVSLRSLCGTDGQTDGRTNTTRDAAY